MAPPRHQATSFHGHRQSTAGQQALSAYLHHPTTDTIQPYTTQVSTIQQTTNTDLYTTMPDSNGRGGHLYHRHMQEQPYHVNNVVVRNPHQHQLPPLPPSHQSQQHHHHQQRIIDYQQPSSTTMQPSVYQQPQQQIHQRQLHVLQQRNIKQEPAELVEYNSVDDTPMASPDSSIDHHHHHQHVQRQQLHHHRQQYQGLLVVAPISPSSPPPSIPLPPNQIATDDDTMVSDSDIDLENGSPPNFSCTELSSSHSALAKKFRKATRVTCDICNKDFTDKCYKTQHDQRFHSGEKPYRCGVCGKRFGEQKLLQVHELRHNDSNKAFPCTVCTKSFNFKNDLDRHFMSSHSAEKPYQCVQCEKKFVRLDHKRHHEKTHDDNVEKTKKKKKAMADTSRWHDHGGTQQQQHTEELQS
ncbi:hypothetical protein ACI65C_009562 [Semiaphis heraclei]